MAYTYKRKNKDTTSADGGTPKFTYTRDKTKREQQKQQSAPQVQSKKPQLISSGNKLAEFVASQPKYDVLRNEEAAKKAIVAQSLKSEIPNEVLKYFEAIGRNTNTKPSKPDLEAIENQKKNYRNELSPFEEKSFDKLLSSVDIPHETEIPSQSLADIEKLKSEYKNPLNPLEESNITVTETGSAYNKSDVPEELLSAMQTARRRADNKYYFYNGQMFDLKKLREEGTVVSAIEEEQKNYDQAVEDAEYLESLYEAITSKTELPVDIEQKYGQFSSPNEFLITDYVNSLKKQSASGKNVGSDITMDILNAALLPEDNMTDGIEYIFSMDSVKYNAAHMNTKEKNLYFTIMMTEGVEAADRYYEDLEPYLKRRRSAEFDDIINEIARDANWFERTILTGGESVSTPLSLIEYPFKVDEISNGERYGISNFTGMLENSTNAIAEDISKDSPFWSWAYQLGISGGKSMFTLGITGGNPTATKLIMGADAAVSSMNEAQKRGLSPEQSIIYGTMLGVIEGATESIGLEALFSDPKNTISYLLKNAAAEGSEEALSEVLGTAADLIINTDNAAYVQNVERYKVQGMSDLDAHRNATLDLLGDVALSFAGGAVLGSSLGAGNIGINAYKNSIAQNKSDSDLGKTLLAGENAEGDIKTLTAEANVGDNKKLARAANKVVKSEIDLGELGTRYDASSRDVGRLARLSEEQRLKTLMDTASGADVKSQTIAKLTDSGMKTKQAERAFDLILHDASQEQVSTELGDLIRSNSAIRPIYEQMSEYMSEGAIAKRVAEAEKASPVTDISNRIIDERLKEAGIDVVEDDDFKIDDPVAVESIDEHGNFNVKTESGATVIYDPAEGMPNVSRKVAAKISYASLFDINGANAYLKFAPDNASKSFQTDFEAVYNQGLEGKKFSAIESNIPEDVQQAIYNSGKADLENAAAKSRKAVKEAKKKEASFVKKQIGFKSDRVTISEAAVAKMKSASEKGISEQYKASAAVIEGLAKMLQVNINIVASETDATGNYISPNGIYNRATNTFTFDITAGMENVEDISYTAMVKTAGHELTHFIQNWSPSKYIKLKNITLAFLTKEHGESWIDERLHAIIESNEYHNKKLTLDQARDELVADAFEDVLTEIDFAETVLSTDKTLFDKVHRWVKDHVGEFKKNIGIAVKDVEAQSLAAETMRSAGKNAQKLYQHWADAFTTALENSTSGKTTESDVQLQARYARAKQNREILNLIDEVAQKQTKANKKVYFGKISETNARKIQMLTGIDVSGFKVAIEARQLEHILKDHGPEGKADRSMADPSDIAKIEYVLNSPDNIENSGRTQAYSEYFNERNRTAKTVKYKKNLGNRVYYVVQAVPNTEAKTLYIVTAYISSNGAKKGAPQLINAQGPNATSENGSANALLKMIPQESESVKENLSGDEASQNSARKQTKDFDTVARSEVADALDAFADKLNPVRKAKLKGALIAYREALTKYEVARMEYRRAVRNSNVDLETTALLSMQLEETIIRETENETIFRMSWSELESSLEGFVDKKREQYERGRQEYMSRARATLAELRKNISASERKAREMASKRQTAEFRMRQIELRVQRDRYTSLLNKEKTKIKKAIESPSENASIPKGAEHIAKQLITVIDSTQKVIGTRGYTRSSQELLKMMIDIADAEIKQGKSKSLLERTTSQDKLLLGTRNAMDQLISDLAILRDDYAKLDPEYKPREGEPYKTPNAAAALVYDEAIAGALDDFISEYKGFYPGSPGAMEGLYNCIKIVRSIGHQLTKANKVYIGGKMVDILDLRDKLYKDVNLASEFVAKLLGSNKINQLLTPKTMMHVIFGATENADAFYDLYNEGQTRYITFVNGARDIFKPVEKAIKSNKFNGNKLTFKTDLKYTDGSSVIFNEDLALSFIKICENEDSLRHAVWGGLRVPDIAPYNKGNIKQAYSSNHVIENISTEINKMQKIFGEETTDEYIASVLNKAAEEGKDISDQQYLDLYSKSIEYERQIYREAELMAKYKETADKLKKQLSDDGKKMLVLLGKYYDNYAREKLDETTMEMYGFTKTLSATKTYYPIRVTEEQKNKADNDLVKRDYSLENWGSMKNRKKSKAGIDLFGAVTELSNFVENTAKYYAWTRTLKTSKIILKTQIIRDNGTVTTLAGAAAEKYGSYDAEAKGVKRLKNLFTADFDKYMKELDAEINGATENKTPEWISKMHGAFVTSALVANISPGFKQASALPLVAVDAGYKSFLKAYAKSLAPMTSGKFKVPLMLSKAQMNYVASNSEVYKYRSGGMLDIDFVAMKNNKSAIAKLLSSRGMSWAELADAQVLGHQFYAIWDNIKKSNPNLTAQEAATQAGKQLDKTIQEFQANYTVLQRAPLLRSGNVSKLIFGTFRSQQITLLNAQVDSLVKSHSISEQAKHASGAEKARLQKELTASRKRSAKIAVATAFSNALNGLLGALVTLIRRKEKDGEEIAEDAFFDFLDSYFTMIPGFGDAASYFVDRFTDRAYFGDGFASIGFLETLSDFISATADLIEAPFSDNVEFTDIVKGVTSVLAAFGIPARNAYNIIKMLIEWVEGIAGLFGVNWEVDTEEW